MTEEKRIYNLKFLTKFCLENKIELNEKYEKLNRNSLISGKCVTCKFEFVKTFRDIVERGGPYCKECTKNRQKDKTKETKNKNNPCLEHEKLSSLEIFNKTKDGRYNYGEDNFEQQKMKYVHDKLIEKWQKEYEDKKINIGSVEMWHKNQVNTFNEKDRKFEIIDDKIMCTEICVLCKERKILTPLYFNFRNIEEYQKILDLPSGKYSVINKKCYGCRECNKKNKKENFTTEDYGNSLLRLYKNLSRDWYDSIPNTCSISNIPLVEERHAIWRVSIQNNDTKTDHLPENCCKIAFEFNVAERDAVEHLIEAYKNNVFPAFIKELQNISDTTHLIDQLKINYNNSPKKNVFLVENNKDYYSQLRKHNIKTILKDQAQSYKKQDKMSKRERIETDDILSGKQLFNKLIKQKMKCFYTGIPFSTDKDTWNFWSLERLDNNKNHTNANTVFICRIFNSSGGLNRKKILYALLTQIHVPLSNDVKMKIEKELKS